MQSKNKSHFDSVPAEILQYILSFIPEEMQVREVSKRFKNLLQ